MNEENISFWEGAFISIIIINLFYISFNFFLCFGVIIFGIIGLIFLEIKAIKNKKRKKIKKFEEVLR